jgi:hypothetical protein
MQSPPGGAAGDGTYNSDPVSRAMPQLLLQRNDGGLIDVTEPEDEDSDFTELLRERRESLDEAGGDDLAQQVIYNQKRKRALKEDAPFVRIVPQSMLRGLGGGIATVTQPPGGASPQIFGGLSSNPAVGLPGVSLSLLQVANWVGEDSIESVPITCLFSPVQQQFGSTVSALRPFGVVDFGNVGYLNRVYVDIGQGCQFTIGCSRALLSVGLDPVAGVTAAQAMQLSAALSFNPIVRTTHLTRTVYLDQLTGTTAKVNRPPFAQSVIFQRADPTVSVNLNFIDSVGTKIMEFDLAANAFMSDAVQLPSDCAEIDVVRTGNNTQARLIFFLSL